MPQNNFYLTEILIATRTAELRRQAEIERLVAGNRVKNAGGLARFLSWSGEMLIQTGQGLKARFALENPSHQMMAETGPKVQSTPQF